MRTQIMCFSKLLAAVSMGAALYLGASYFSQANAAQGCGFGSHMTAFGRCVPNDPGPGARPAPGRPDCWINMYNQLRCYR